jgi:curved DNA-binding protein CbpA
MKQAWEQEKLQFCMKNYYQILEVKPDASHDEIKEQYLFLIQAWHPDKFSNPAQKTKAEDRTKELNAAYEVLRNSVKRAEYDRSIRSAKPTQEPEYRRPEQAQAARQKEDQLREERSNQKRGKIDRSNVKVFLDGQERIMKVDDLVKASVQYFDQQTKEDLGSDYFRTHAAVRAAASRCLKYGVEIHVRKLAA